MKKLSKKASYTSKPVRFSAKGQLVIPQKILRQFDIEAGTRARVIATPEGILIKPTTAEFIKRGRGILKRKPSGLPLDAEWKEHKKRELRLERINRPQRSLLLHKKSRSRLTG